ncbi:hypothetical protein ACWD7C_36090 [Streptomyces sp. NPDC005134]|uniref:hypothetical protein n=1 Tax=unclassified Streptomyces TaxID=2593676 RepID=UPI0033B5D4D1
MGLHRPALGAQPDAIAFDLEDSVAAADCRDAPVDGVGDLLVGFSLFGRGVQPSW